MNCGRLPCDEAVILATPSSIATPPVVAAPPAAKAAMQTGVWVLVATVLGSSMEYIDGTVVNVALPSMQTGLGASGSQVQWVVEAYALFLSALLLVGGSMGDIFGRRRIFVIGVTVFAAASVWCGVAPNVQQLIAARCLQGVGGAMLVPNSLALISSCFPPETRGKAIGTWSGFSSMVMALGPVVGGWLVQHGSWRWVFFINAPLAVITVMIALRKLPEHRNGVGAHTLDWRGAVLATAGLSGVTFALMEWTQGGVMARVAAIAGVALLCGFVWVEKRCEAPMMPLSLFESRNFVGANVLTFFLYAALGGALFYLPLNLIQVQGYSPTAAGASLLPFVLLVFLLSRWSGGLVARYGVRLPLIAGPLIAAVGYALTTRPWIGGSYWTTYFPGIVVLGLGMAVSVAPLTTVVMNSVDESRTGSASGVNNATSQVAGLLALAMFGLIFFRVFSPALDRGLKRADVSAEVAQEIGTQRVKLAAIETTNAQGRVAVDEAFVTSFRVVFWLAAGLAGAASLSAALILREEKAA
jgi:EmrB/QacA subfamily drug resistance transporter